MTRHELSVFANHPTLKFMPIMKIAEALVSAYELEKNWDEIMTFDELVDYVESWIISDIDSYPQHPAYKKII